MATVQRAMGLLRRSLGFTPPTAQRALSSSAAPAADGAAEAAAKEAKKRRKKKNLFDVVQFLPGWGVGYKVAKTTWRDVSYQLTKINLYKVLTCADSFPFAFHFELVPVCYYGFLQCRTVAMGRRGGFGTRRVSFSHSLQLLLCSYAVFALCLKMLVPPACSVFLLQKHIHDSECFYMNQHC
jgi:hypothetical protein